MLLCNCGDKMRSTDTSGQAHPLLSWPVVTGSYMTSFQGSPPKDTSAHLQVFRMVSKSKAKIQSHVFSISVSETGLIKYATGKFPINGERLLPKDPACRAKGQKTPVWDLGDSCQGSEKVERIPLLIKLQPPPTCQVPRLQNSTAFNGPTARVLMEPENLYHFKVRTTPPGIFVVSTQQMGVGMGVGLALTCN